jgi:hypothetical protein
MVLAVASNSNSWKVYERQGCNHTHQIDEANNGIVCESAKKLGSQESEELNNG